MWQSADAQFDRVDLVEMLYQLIGGHADKAGGKTTLGRERGPRALGQSAHRPCDRHVLGQIEIMQPELRRHGRDAFIAEVGQAGHDRVGRVLGKMHAQPLWIAGVKLKRDDMVEAMGLGHRTGGRAIQIGELDLIVAGFAKQTGDERADFTGAEDKNAVHKLTPWR